MIQQGKRTVFLDRDNTLMHDPGYTCDPAMVELLPGVAEALKRLQDAGFELIVITNQSGVARGMFGIDAVESVNAKLAELLAAEGVELGGFYICPHHPDDNCTCRKPEPGLILRAVEEKGLDLENSFLIGDRRSDIETGKRLGIASYLVLTSLDEEDHSDGLDDDQVVQDLNEAVNRILSRKDS